MTTPLNETEATITPVQAGTDHQTKGDRFTSFSAADFSVPRGKDEDWRFTPLRELRGLHDGSAVAGKRAAVAVGVSDDDAPSVTVEQLEPGDERLGRAGAPVDRAAAQAWENTESADYVRVSKDAALKAPVTITVDGPGEDEVSYGTLVVELEPHAEAVVFVRYEGSGAHSDLSLIHI